MDLKISNCKLRVDGVWYDGTCQINPLQEGLYKVLIENPPPELASKYTSEAHPKGLLFNAGVNSPNFIIEG